MSDCVFCKIVKKQIPADLVFEDEDVLVFKDIAPKAATHLLIVTKKHIESVMSVEDVDRDLMGNLILKARDIAKGLALKGYKLQVNVGEHGGQEVFHLHVHLLSKFS